MGQGRRPSARSGALFTITSEATCKGRARASGADRIGLAGHGDHGDRLGHGTGVLGNLIGANNGSPFVAVVVRTVLVLIALATTIAFVVARSDGSSGAVWLSASVVAYLLVPLSWDGSLLFGNQFLPWWGASIFDLCIWTLIALGVVEFESTSRAAGFALLRRPPGITSRTGGDGERPVERDPQGRHGRPRRRTRPDRLRWRRRRRTAAAVVRGQAVHAAADAGRAADERSAGVPQDQRRPLHPERARRVA